MKILFDAAPPLLNGELIGALIALARAAENEEPDAVVHRAVLHGLCACAGCSAQMSADALNAVREAKGRLVPSCASCTAPCGRTAEYPLSELLAEPDGERAALKLSLLFSLHGLALTALPPFEAGALERQTLDFLYRALFALGYLFEASHLRELIGTAGQLALRWAGWENAAHK